MRVKVGNRWYRAKPGRPIMVELNPLDRAAIAGMAPDQDRYAQSCPRTPITHAEMEAWMDAGAIAKAPRPVEKLS